MIAPTLTFHGAAGTVTGSCFELAFARRRVLVDCGLFQGPRSLEALNFQPFAFNPAEIDNAIRLVRAIRAQGSTIIFVEHLMRAVVELSDRVAVLNEGKLFALGKPREVMRDPRVVSIYLGKAYAA